MTKPKKQKSIPVTFSIEPGLFNEFEKFVEDNFIDRSRLVEHLILEHIKSKKKK